MSLQQQLYLGIDGGGTKCKARLEDANGTLLGEGLAGPANPVRDLQQTLDAIRQSSQQAILEAGLPAERLADIVAGVGLAGVNLPDFQHKVQQWKHPFASMHLTTDLHIACLGAHKGEDGAVIIAGTGFCAGSVIDGNQMEIGGHGFILGDNGSGARLGAQAIRKTLEVLDGIAQVSPMTDAILHQLGKRNATSIVQDSVNAKPSYYANFAPLVIKYAHENDPHALEIVNRGAKHIGLVARRLMEDSPPRLSMIGGIADAVHPWLDLSVAKLLSPALLSPEMGAILYAHRQNKKST